MVAASALQVEVRLVGKIGICLVFCAFRREILSWMPAPAASHRAGPKDFKSDEDMRHSHESLTSAHGQHARVSFLNAKVSSGGGDLQEVSEGPCTVWTSGRRSFYRIQLLRPSLFQAHLCIGFESSCGFLRKRFLF